MHHAFKATILAAPKGALKNLATALLSQAAAKAACFYAFGFLPDLGFLSGSNGSRYSLNDS